MVLLISRLCFYAVNHGMNHKADQVHTLANARYVISSSIDPHSYLIDHSRDTRLFHFFKIKLTTKTKLNAKSEYLTKFSLAVRFIFRAGTLLSVILR